MEIGVVRGGKPYLSLCRKKKKAKPPPGVLMFSFNPRFDLETNYTNTLPTTCENNKPC